MEEVIVRIVPLPDGVPAFTLPDVDGYYDVYLNEKLDEIARIRAFEHELEHIRKGDWERLDYMTVAEIEGEIGA